MTDQLRMPAGAPTGGQFSMTARPETSTTLTSSHGLVRFGPNGEHVRALLDRLAHLDADERATLAAHAPTVVTAGDGDVEVFCPAGDATRYVDLPRYRRLTRHPRTSPMLRALCSDMAAALEAADGVAHGLAPASADAIRDATAAMVVRGRIHAIAYETLTRAVRQAVGRIHPEDGPLHR